MSEEEFREVPAPAIDCSPSRVILTAWKGCLVVVHDRLDADGEISCITKNMGIKGPQCEGILD